MREKLIELLRAVQYQGNAVHGYHDTYIQNSELADYLIANGVTIFTPFTVPELTEEQIEELRERLRNSRPQLITHDLEPQIVVVNKQQWIPVSERLPDLYEECFVLVKMKYDWEEDYERNVDSGCYVGENGYIDGFNTYNDWNEGQEYLHVTHWMPLPEPPKEG